MNKTEFIQELRRELGGEATSREAEQVLDAVLNTIARSCLLYTSDAADEL